MIRFFLSLLLFSSHFVRAQEKAWYIGSRFDADLILVETNSEVSTVLKSLRFGDTLTESKYNNITRDYITALPDIFYASHEQKFPKSTLPDVRSSGEHEMSQIAYISYYCLVDSVEVDKTWYPFHCTMSDDLYIGGRPNSVLQHIAVSQLGVIFSFSNWFDHHCLFMISHSDPQKQKVLSAVYARLKVINNWSTWSKIETLANRLSFDSTEKTLGNEWMNSRDHIRVVESSYENVNGMINAKITLQNVSDVYYKFPKYFTIAPSHGVIYYENVTSDWDLLDSHYGESFKQMKQDVYLSPGEKVTFNYSFNRYIGCGSCTNVTYDGFQIYSLNTYVDWLLQDTVQHNGKNYVLYPHREIKP